MKKLKKKNGSGLLPIFIIFTFILLFILLDFELTKYTLVSEGETCSDKLISANLASLNSPNINLDLLSESPSKKIIMIKDPNLALETWEKHLKYNFGLDDNYEPESKTSFIKSKVDIKRFIIYNVNIQTNDVTVYTLNPSTHQFDVEDHPNGKGNLKTDKGNTIQVTSLDTDIGFTINMMFGHTKYVEVSEDSFAYKK